MPVSPGTSPRLEAGEAPRPGPWAGQARGGPSPGVWTVTQNQPRFQISTAAHGVRVQSRKIHITSPRAGNALGSSLSSRRRPQDQRRGPQLHTHATQRALCPEPPSWDAAGPELRVRTRARPTCRPWRRGGAPRGAGVRVWAPSRVVSDTGTPPHAARDPQVPLQKPLEGAGLRPARASRACLLRIVLTGALGSRCSGRHLRPLGRVSHEDGKSVGPPGCGARRVGAAPGQAQARVPAPHPQWGRDQQRRTPASALEPSCSAAQARPPQATLAGRRDPRGVGRWPRAARQRHPSSYSQLE